MKRRAQGLTLIEMLIALFIMAILSVLSYRTVSAMTETNRHLDRVGREFGRLVDAVETVDRDLAFASDLSDEIAFRGDGGGEGRDGEIRFIRAASGYLSGPKSSPTPVGYRLRDNRFEKLIYPDNLFALTDPEVRVLLTDAVKSLKFRFRDRTGRWHASWPTEEASGLPAAVEYRLKLAGGGEIVRVTALP
jgi:general secretion pathway protein J